MVTIELLIEKLRAGRKYCTFTGYTDEEGLSFLLDIKRRTLRAWRAEQKGPPYGDHGRIVYPLEGIAAWMNAGGNRHETADTGEKRQFAAGDGK